MAENIPLYVKASVLDRLSRPRDGDNFSGTADGGAEDQFQTSTEVVHRDSVLRDLEWLFNSVSPLSLDDADMRRKYPHAAKSVLSYGLRGVLGKMVTNPEEIKQHVLRALKMFEPRLEVESLSLRLSSEGQLIEIEIKGMLLTQHARRKLWIRTDLQTLNSSIKTGNG